VLADIQKGIDFIDQYLSSNKVIHVPGAKNVLYFCVNTR
jgi:hypothetical protein